MKKSTIVRILFSLFVIAAVWLIRDHNINALIDGKLAAATIQPSDSNYVAQQARGPVTFTMTAIGLAVLVLVWSGPALRYMGLFILSPLLLTGCGPARTDQFVEVGPSETAFVIPLQGDNQTSQGKFNSSEYLNSKKVAAKRVQLPLVSKNTGRMWYDYEWIPAVRVICVNRQMVSREWSPPSTGSGGKDESIPVITKDSIQLGVGCAITAFIEEEDAAAYLYYHGEKKLSEVMDSNIRNWCVSELTKEYGQMDLQQAQTNFPTIFARVFAEAKIFFKTKGVTIQQFGNAEGYEFKRPEIQKALNATFIAEQDNKTAVQEKLAQDVRNQKLFASAETERKAAEELFKAREASTMKNQLEIEMIRAKANATMADRWDGKLPSNILPANSPLLMNLTK